MNITNKDFTIEPLNENAPAIFKDVISKIPFPYWVSAGTALGLYRDGDFIAGDTDIDFAALGSERCSEAILEALAGYPVVRTIYVEDKPMQIAFKKDGVIVDFYFHWKDGDEYYNISENGEQRMPCGIYDTLSQRETKYGLVSFPAQVEEYLAIRYGDWETPTNEKPKNYV